MTTGAASALFLDTNVLVYANVASAPLHDTALEAIRRHYQSGTRLWISRQVIREYLATLSRPQTFTRPRPMPILAERASACALPLLGPRTSLGGQPPCGPGR